MIKDKTKKILLILLISVLIFILGFAIRGHLLKYDYLFEYDPYWHLRVTGYVLQGELPSNDPLGFYLTGGTRYTGWPSLLWGFTAWIYKITTFGASYNKELLMSYARVLPAIFGALIAVSMFFLGKKMYDTKTGIMMGLLSAVIPAFVYRTMAGFFEEDALGFLWMVIGFIFLVMAIERSKLQNKIKSCSIIYAIIAGLFFWLMAITWEMFLLIPLVLIAYYFTQMVYLLIRKEKKQKIIIFSIIFAIAFFLFATLTTISGGPVWINRTTEYVTQYLPISSDNLERISSNTVVESDVVGATVGEENTGKQFFLEKYSLLIFIPFLVLPIIIINFIRSAFTKKGKEKPADFHTLIIFYWLLITTFMAWTKLKFTYTLGLPIAAGAAYLFYLVFNYIKDKSLLKKRIFAFFVLFMVLGSIAAGIHFVITKVNPIEQEPDWLDTMNWIKENTGKEVKIFNWWDYGHWITYFTERKASTDNTNSNNRATSDFGKFIISQDINESKELLRKYDADYVLVDSKTLQKHMAFALYAHLTINYQDPRVQKYLSMRSDCQKHKTPITNVVSYVCNNQSFTEEGFLDMPTTWKSTPYIVDQGTPLYVYRDLNNSAFYLFNNAVNKTIFVRLWFNDPSVEPILDLVYSKGDVRLYKVNKELLNN
jgi:asparagine N-glycosylation enzyme membrane subunit Stt3